MGLNDEIERAVRWDAPSVDVNESLREVIKKMAGSKTSALVVKSANEVIGIVTDMDVMGSIDKNDDLDQTKTMNFMTPCELISKEGAKSPCAQLDSGQTVASALGVMNLAATHHLLVSGDGGKVGMVSITDLLALVA